MTEKYVCDRCKKETTDWDNLKHYIDLKNPKHWIWKNKPEYSWSTIDLCHDCIMDFYEWRDNKK